MSGLIELQKYWDGYVRSLQVRGSDWGSKQFFQQIKEEHDRAYAYSNAILNIPAQKGKCVLEVGCGIGIDALELAKHGAAVTYVSPSPKSLELTAKYFAYHELHSRLLLGEAENLSFAANTFDVVIARGVLMFTLNSKIAADEIFRVLKPGGRVYAHLHNKYSWYVFLSKLSKTDMISEKGDPQISTLHSVRDVDEIFCRFTVRNVELDRLPLRTNRPGHIARLYNSLFIPFTKLIPKRFIQYFGYYIIVDAVKP